MDWLTFIASLTGSIVKLAWPVAAFGARVVQFSMDFYDFDSEGDVESGAVAGVFDVVGS